jgi:hypothetical protein
MLLVVHKLGVRAVSRIADPRIVSLAPRQIDRGDMSGIAGKIQKQGNTEAGPVGEREP